MKTLYTFNENGVCTNPTVVLQKECKQYSAQLTVFQAPNGKWGTGYRLNINFGNMRYSGGPPSKNRAEFKTMEEARKSVLEWYTKTMPEFVESAKEWNRNQKASREYQNDLNAARQGKPRNDQPTLF